jgi:hypothetical protein
VGDYGISFNLALGLTSHGNRYERQPDFGDCPRRQERGCHPCSRTERLVDLVNAQKKMSWFYLVLTARLQRTYNDN